jgi:uncharacterized protein YdhG (YjbR/CyaY superfamily)
MSTGPDTPSARIDAMLAGLPDDQRAALQDLRESIHRAAPEAEEAISYSLPAFRYRGRPLVSYGAAKSHVAFYVMSPAAIEAHRDALSGYDTSKGAIRFRPPDRLPDDLVTAIVRTRMAEADAAAKR